MAEDPASALSSDLCLLSFDDGTFDLLRCLLRSAFDIRFFVRLVCTGTDVGAAAVAAAVAAAGVLSSSGLRSLLLLLEDDALLLLSARLRPRADKDTLGDPQTTNIVKQPFVSTFAANHEPCLTNGCLALLSHLLSHSFTQFRSRCRPFASSFRCSVNCFEHRHARSIALDCLAKSLDLIQASP